MNPQPTKMTFKQILNIAVVSAMLLLENMDTNIINIAVPTIAKSLHTHPLELKLAITSYLISLAIFVPISGWVADKFGTQKTLFCSILGFSVLSICCGLSQSLTQLVIFRFLQGISGAFMMPVGRLLLLKVFGKKELVKVFILMAMPGVLGPLLAPLVGGLIVAHLHWGYIFGVNVPIGIMGLFITHKYVDNFTEKVNIFNWAAFIWLGLLLAIASLTLDTIFYPLAMSSRIILLILIVVCLFVYIKIEKKSVNQVVNYKLFSIRTFRLCFMSNIALRIAFGGRAFVLGLYLQLALGLSPLHAGYMLSSAALGLFSGRMLIKRILPHFGFRKLLIYANVAAVVTSVMYLFILKANFWALIIIVSNSFFTTMVFILLNTLFFADVPERHYASATSISNTIQQLFNSFGVTALATILFMANLVLPHFSYKVFMIAFMSIAVIGVILQLLLLKLRPHDGDNLLTK